ncbi:MAG: alpha/beta fold hydrolase [Eubacteriales bacterium]
MNFKNRFATILALAGTTTLVLHIINRVITLTSTLDNNLNTNRGTFYNWRFGKIYYTSEGSGSPVLLIHDLEHYSSAYEWHKTIKSLSKTNTVYTMDLIGCGRSDKPNITYTNFLFVQLITDFVNEVVKEKCDIVASSYSSSLAITSATYDKNIINRLICINPRDLSQTSKVPTTRTKLSKLIIKTPIIGTFIYNMRNKKKSYINNITRNFYHNPDLITASEIKHFHEAAHLGGFASKFLYASIKGNYVNTNILHSLKTVNNSIFIIASDSTPNYLTSAEQYKKTLPAIEIITSYNTNKYPQLESPETVVEQIRYLLDV